MIWSFNSARSNSHRGGFGPGGPGPGSQGVVRVSFDDPVFTAVTTESFARGEISLLSLKARSPGAGLSLVALRSISLQIRFRCLLIQSLIQASHKTINNNAEEHPGPVMNVDFGFKRAHLPSNLSFSV